ncbi:MAG: hypothetical protein U0930_17075 [Pirellulales bacterium]
MSAGSPTFSNYDIGQALKPFRGRVLQLRAFKLAMFTATTVLALCFVLLWLDTIWAMPSVVRWFASRVALFSAIAVGLAYAIIKLRTITQDSVAQQIDQKIQSGGEILAGLQLATRPVEPSSELSTGLAMLAARQAAQRLTQIAPSLVAPLEQLKQSSLALLAVVVASGFVACIVPSIALHQLNRFLTPYADVPPYTGITIELELEKESVLYGQDTLVKAHISGGRVERVQLVIEPESGPELIMPMLASGESAYQAMLTRVTQPLTLHAKSGISRSKKLKLDITLTPQLLSPKVRITPPAYTRTAPYVGPIPEKGVSGLSGTQVQWMASSNRPLSSGLLKITYRDGEEEKIELAAAKGEGAEETSVSGISVLSKPGQFELSVIDVDGTQSIDRVTGAIAITEDRRPVVRIIQPQPLSIATPDIQLPTVVMADDDYGITKLTLFRSLNGSPATPIDAELESQARVQHQWMLNLPSYGLESGDEIQLFARTEDNDPAGAKGAESPVTLIKIISVAEFQELMVQQRGAEMLQAKYQAARRHLENLASALKEVQEAQEAAEADSQSAEAAGKLQEKLGAAQKAARQAAAEIQKLGEQPLPIDVDKELSEMLKEMSQQAADAGEAVKQIQQAADPNLSEADQQKLEEMIKAMKDMQDELTESAIDPLGKMQKLMPLMMDQQRFEQLANQQKDLAERMRGLESADADDPATQRRVAELESEQEQLKQQLEQLLDDIEQHADDLPPDPETDKLRETAKQFTEAVRESMASEQMTEAQSKMLGDKFKDAQSAAQQAAETLQQFLDDSEQMGDKACENCKAGFKPGKAKIGNSLKQMMEMMGMRPGRSGMKPGNSPGQGFNGPANGYSTRSPGQKNIGMYGSIPTPQQSQSRGRGDKQSQGVQTSQAIDATSGGNASTENTAKGSAGGQELNAVPSNYRTKVADYFRSLSEKMGDIDEDGK